MAPNMQTGYEEDINLSIVCLTTYVSLTVVIYIYFWPQIVSKYVYLIVPILSICNLQVHI